MAKPTQQPLGDLGQLAETLIARHLKISVPDAALRDDLLNEHGNRADRLRVERPTRCVAIVGSGASAPLLPRGNKLAKKLEADFGRDEAELERLKLVTGMDTDALETRLVALSRSPEAVRRIREAISDTYNVRYPSLLVNELLAHLLKHRFLDAILSFNFDELLDQSLDDELHENEYARIVSDSDCSGIQSDADAADYVPLYVKLHGTASEPDSLRFTFDSYFALPQRVVEVVKRLLRTDRCVVVNVGFGMASFDIHRLLAVPRELEIYDFSKEPIQKQDRKMIRKQRALARGGKGGTNAKPRNCNPDQRSADDAVSRLLDEIERRVDDGAGLASVVAFRSVRRHKTVARLLRDPAVDGRWLGNADTADEQRAEYAWRRTVIELAFSAAKARGLLSLAPLVVDRPGRYFDAYQWHSRGRQSDAWRQVCAAAGLEESAEVPDILISKESLAKDPAASGGASEVRSLREFDPKRLAAHVLAKVRPSYTAADYRDLHKTLRQLQSRSDIEIHTRDDRVCAKAFRAPVLLTTETALDVYSQRMLVGLTPEDEVYAYSETGHWMRSKRARDQLRQAGRLRLILAFDIEESEVRDCYAEGQVESIVIDPWQHSRHMTIVTKAGKPVRALYFARRLRSPVITPVYLDDRGDVETLKRMFEERWTEAVRRRALDSLDFTLRQAIQLVLDENGNEWMSAHRLAEEINARALYKTRDRSPVDASQVDACAAKHRGLFEDDGPGIRRVPGG